MLNAFTLTSADLNKVPVHLIKRGGRRLVIASHGITSEKTEDGLYTKFAGRLPEEFDTALFDFRGHGASELSTEQTTIAGEVLDLMTVFNWARTQPYLSIDHVATSFGASISLLALSAYRLEFLRRVAFWNPVTNYQNTFIDGTREWGRTFFNQASTDELSVRQFTTITDTSFHISALMTQELLLLHPEEVKWPSSIPLFILHGDKDSLVPVSDAREYARRNNAKITILHGVDHGFDHLVDEAMQLTASWLEK